MAITISKISENSNATKLLVKGMQNSFINSIRRAAMEEVAVLAIENISIYENDAVMFDEFLAHRLAMLPVSGDKSYKLGDKAKLVLEKEGPCTVMSSDIKSTDPNVEIVNKNIPITKLAKGQKIKIEMDAVMGKGKEHAKWQPAIVAFQEVASIEMQKGCDECEACIKACPKNVLELKAKKVVLKDAYNCILCGACRDACKNKALVISREPEQFILTVESHGAIPAKEILLQASAALKGMIKEANKEAGKL